MMKLFALCFLAVPVLSHEGHHHQHIHGDHHPHHHGGHHPHGHGGHESLRPHTHIAYHHVESACAKDVERLCSEKEPAPLAGHPLSNDPFLEWFFSPMTPRASPFEEMSEFTSLIDRMMDSALAMPSHSFVIVETSPSSARREDEAMDSMVTKLAASRPNEIPQLAQQLVQHGHQVLESPVSADRRRLARRLTEVDAGEMHQRVHLPFGCPKNRCLRDAFNRKVVSGECARAMSQLEHVNQLEIELEEQENLFAGMVWIYVGLLTILLIMLARRYRGARGNRRLKIKIMQAVYSNPAIKNQIEREMGESIGDVPPLPTHVLRMMSAGGQTLKNKMFCVRRVQLLFFVFLMCLVFVAPFWVLPLCILASAVRVALLCFAPTPVRECSCCCCGTSTSDVKNGADPPCCSCCKGTGVCAVGCASCCGTSGCCGKGCCEGGSCNCCDSKMVHSSPKLEDCSCCCCGATPESAKNGTITKDQAACCCCCGTGVPRGMVNGCCCCCGLSLEAAKNGMITEDQACCCCCGGTGVPRCASSGCCAPRRKTKGRGQKHQFNADEGIYHGIPLQVV